MFRRNVGRVGFGRVIALLAIAPILSLVLFLPPALALSEKALLEKALLAFTPEVVSWRCTINSTMTLKEGLYARPKTVRPVTLYLEGTTFSGKPFVREFFIGYYDNVGDGADVCIKFNKMVKKRKKDAEKRRKK